MPFEGATVLCVVPVLVAVDGKRLFRGRLDNVAGGGSVDLEMRSNRDLVLGLSSAMLKLESEAEAKGGLDVDWFDIENERDWACLEVKGFCVAANCS